MKPIWDAWFCHIEVTNVCTQNCAYCTRYIRHVRKDQEFFMDLEYFRRALESLDGFMGRIGIMGGEPTLHPQFEEICHIIKNEYRIPRMKMGLWTAGGVRFKQYRKLIDDTFGMLAYNEHNPEQRKVERHQPLTVAVEDVVADKRYRQKLIDDCPIQKAWCPSINPKGGFFCEVAQALDIILDGPGGYPIEPGWWKKGPSQFKDQVDRYCKHCGAPLPLKKGLLGGKEAMSSGLLALFKSHKLRRLSATYIAPYDKQLLMREIERARLAWDPRNFRQDLQPDMEEGYKNRAVGTQIGGPLRIRKVK